MNYTELENVTTDDRTIISWRRRHDNVQLACPYCDRFFDIPLDVAIDRHGYASDRIYHFCDDMSVDEDLHHWVVQPHLVGWHD